MMLSIDSLSQQVRPDPSYTSIISVIKINGGVGMINRIICFVIIGLLFGMVPITVQAVDASRVPAGFSQQKTYKCYGNSNPTVQTTSTLSYTDWYRCDGVEVSNEYIICPRGYVSVVVYTWRYTTGWPERWVSRCRVACAEVTAEAPVSNCRWE